MKVRKVIVHRFRQVAPGAVELDAPVVAVLGRNGAGKTTLLELLGLMASWDFSPLRDEEFDVEFAITVTGDDGVGHALSFRVSQSASEGAPPTLGPQRHWWSYSMRADDGSWLLHATSGGGSSLTVGGSDRAVRAESPFEDFFLFAAFSGVGLESIPPSLSAVWDASQRQGLPRFDEELGAYRALKAASEPSVKTSWGLRARPLRAWTMPSKASPISTRFAFNWGFQDIEVETDRIDTGAVALEAAKLEELRRICDQLAVADARLHLQLIDSDALRGRGQVRAPEWGNFTLQFQDGRGGWRFDGRLSYGQRRLLSLLLWIYGARDLVLIDELTNGLHHEWIQGVLDAIGDRQAILATQSPLLLDYLEFESAEDVRRGFVFCESDGVTMTWRNPTTAEAELAFSAIRVGIEHVSEVLRNRGLW